MRNEIILLFDVIVVNCIPSPVQLAGRRFSAIFHNFILPAMNSKREAKKTFDRTLFKSEDTVSLEEAFDLINFFGKVLGLRFSYEWKYNLRFRFTMTCFAFYWSQIFYSQFKFAANGEHKRIMEVFPLYGISISVSGMILLFERRV